jgi:hypothetical protein
MNSKRTGKLEEGATCIVMGGTCFQMNVASLFARKAAKTQRREGEKRR